MEFRSLLNLRPLLLLLALVVATGAAQAPEQRTDPDGLIRFLMPTDWNNDRFANGRHFQRADRPDDKAILAVLADESDAYVTLDSIRKGRSSVHAAQDHQQVVSKEQRIGPFDAWEAIYEANIKGDDVIMHEFALFSDTRFVEVTLVASTDTYQEYLPDLLAVVNSVEALDGSPENGSPEN